MTKLSTGYWQVFDPTNGYTAIHADALRAIPLDKLANRYFFESDLLFRLGTIRAVVRDVPMPARYADEQSNLSIPKVLGPFLAGHLRSTVKRFTYSYLLRDFNVASVLVIVGAPSILAGILFGSYHWVEGIRSGVPASSGTVMLAALPIVLGLQMLLGALSLDVASSPTVPLQSLMRGKGERSRGLVD
jgi:dolichol-phosphate mannosyltransferase